MAKRKNLRGFGNRIEYWIFGLLLKEGLDVYVPLIDYDGTDLVVKKSNGTFIEIQIRARSKTVAMGNGASFANFPCEKRKNYFYVFYSERLNTFWIMSSEEFLKHSKQNGVGKNIRGRFISFNRRCKDKKTGKYTEPIHERFKKYIAKDFSRFK